MSCYQSRKMCEILASVEFHFLHWQTRQNDDIKWTGSITKLALLSYLLSKVVQKDIKTGRKERKINMNGDLENGSGREIWHKKKIFQCTKDLSFGKHHIRILGLIQSVLQTWQRFSIVCGYNYTILFPFCLIVKFEFLPVSHKCM